MPGIDRHHAVQIRDKVLPIMIPKAADGSVDQKLMSGVLVAELGQKPHRLISSQLVTQAAVEATF